MPAPSVTVIFPRGGSNWPPNNINRPESRVEWSDGTGPDYDVLHEWDTVNTFDSPDLIQDNNLAVAGPADTGIPPADMPSTASTWFYRVTVEDNADSASTTSGTVTITFVDPIDNHRFLYLLANVGVGFDPTDTPAAGWDPEAIGTPDAGDGYTIDFDRFLYLLANVGVGFDPTDTPAAGWDPTGTSGADAGDGYTIDFDRFLYLLALVDTTVPTPHIWYVFPDFGREGWEFKIIGYGFGDTQATYNGNVLLNALGCSVVDWQAISESSPNLTIDADDDIAEPIHQQVRAVVPAGAESGLVFIVTDA